MTFSESLMTYAGQCNCCRGGFRSRACAASSGCSFLLVNPCIFVENDHRNAPANIIDPINLTAAAVDMAERLGLSAKILDEKELVCCIWKALTGYFSRQQQMHLSHEAFSNIANLCKTSFSIWPTIFTASGWEVLQLGPWHHVLGVRSLGHGLLLGCESRIQFGSSTHSFDLLARCEGVGLLTTFFSSFAGHHGWMGQCLLSDSQILMLVFWGHPPL